MRILYHCGDTRSFRVLWMLEELGLDYELRMLPFPPRVVAPAYLEHNPLGTVPFYLDAEVRMTESAAICQYLAARHPGHGLDVRATEPGYGAYLNALHFGEATLTVPLTLILRYGQFEPAARRMPQVVDDYRTWFMARAGALAPWLDAGDYTAAGRFTAADIIVGYPLLLADYLGLIEKCPLVIREYFSRLQLREGFARAVEVQRRSSRETGVPITEIARMF